MSHRSNRVTLLACLTGSLAQSMQGTEWSQEPKSFKLTTAADHSKFKELQREFKSGPELTKACLIFHTEAAGQIHRTKHWKWKFRSPDAQQLTRRKNPVAPTSGSLPMDYKSGKATINGKS